MHLGPLLGRHPASQPSSSSLDFRNNQSEVHIKICKTLLSKKMLANPNLSVSFLSKSILSLRQPKIRIIGPKESPAWGLNYKRDQEQDWRRITMWLTSACLSRACQKLRNGAMPLPAAIMITCGTGNGMRTWVRAGMRTCIRTRRRRAIIETRKERVDGWWRWHRPAWWGLVAAWRMKIGRKPAVCDQSDDQSMLWYFQSPVW